MQVVSVIKDSFQEYDGEHSLVLFCYGCNLNCVGCYNKESIYGDVKYETALDAVKDNITPLHTAIVFLGGECLSKFHKLKVIEEIKNIKNCVSSELKIKIYTNGMEPDLVGECIGLVDAWSIDWKASDQVCDVIGCNYSDFEYEDTLLKSIGMIIDSDGLLEVRTTKFNEMSKEYWESQILKIESKLNQFGNDVSYIVQDDFVELFGKVASYKKEKKKED